MLWVLFIFFFILICILWYFTWFFTLIISKGVIYVSTQSFTEDSQYVRVSGKKKSLHTLYQLIPEVPCDTGAIIRLHVKKSRLRGVGDLRGKLNGEQKGWVAPETGCSPEQHMSEPPQRPCWAQTREWERGLESAEWILRPTLQTRNITSNCLAFQFSHLQNEGIGLGDLNNSVRSAKKNFIACHLVRLVGYIPKGYS